MSKGTLKRSFEYFREVLINEQDRSIASGHLCSGKDLIANSKKNHNISSNKHSKPHNQGSSSSYEYSSNMVYNKKKAYNP